LPGTYQVEAFHAAPQVDPPPPVVVAVTVDAAPTTPEDLTAATL
jgi:hypothetical protein